MNPDNCDSQATEKKLSEQFAEFIDLADEDLEEVEVLEFGGIRGGQGGGGPVSGCMNCPCGPFRGGPPGFDAPPGGCY
jgi:hypothetical protein